VSEIKSSRDLLAKTIQQQPAVKEDVAILVCLTATTAAQVLCWTPASRRRTSCTALATT
jgi:hypothetical protein